MFLMILFGWFDDIAEAEMTKKVKANLTGAWHYILEKIVGVFNDAVMEFTKSFSPDMRTFLTALGYDGDTSGFAGVVWTQAQDATLNIFAIFATMGYLIAIAILVISLIKSAMANVVDSKEDAPVLLLRFVAAFLMITHANSIVKLFMDIGCKLWDWLLTNGDSSTISNPALALTLKDNGEATLGPAGTGTAISLSSLNGLLACILLIIMVIEFFKMIIEIVGKYIILGLLYIIFPTVAGTFVSRTTSGVMKKYFSMLFSQLFLMLVNVWCVSMFFRLLLNIGSVQTDALFQCLTVIAFERFSQKIDSYMKQLGLNNAVTGANLLDQIRVSSGSLLAMPGNIASTVRTNSSILSAPAAGAAMNAMNNHEFAKANRASNFILNPLQQASMKQDIMKHAAAVALSPSDVASMKIDGAILSGMGHGFTPESAASAIETAGGDAIRSALQDQFGMSAGDITLGSTAKWDNKDGAWHINGMANGSEFGLQIAPSENSPVGQTPVTSFTDSNGHAWNVFAGKKEGAAGAGKSSASAAQQAAAAATAGTTNGAASASGSGRTARSGAGAAASAASTATAATAGAGTTAAAFTGFGPDAIDKNGYIRNPFAAVQMTGIPNKYGLKANADGSYTRLTKDGRSGHNRFIPTAQGGYMPVYDSGFIAGAVGFGSDSYRGKTISSYTNSEGNITNPYAAMAFTGINNSHGLHVSTTPDGTTVYEPIDANGDVVTGVTVPANNVGSAVMGVSEQYAARGGLMPFLSSEEAEKNGIADAQYGVVINRDGTYSYMDADGKADSTEYLFGVDNPYGVENLGNNNYRILDKPDADTDVDAAAGDAVLDTDGADNSFAAAAKRVIEEDDIDVINNPVENGGEEQDDESVTTEDVNDLYDVPSEDDVDEDYDQYSSLAGETIHLNDDGSYSVLGEDGEAEDDVFHLPGEDSEAEFYRDENGDFHERLAREASDVTMELNDLQDDGNGGYTGTMTMHGLYADSDDDADLKVRIADQETRMGDEQVISTFVDPDTGKDMAVFASDKDIAQLVKDSAGKDIDNENIGNAMLGMDAEAVQNEADEYTDEDNPVGNVTHIDESGTTVSRMDTEYSSAVRRRRKSKKAKNAAAKRNAKKQKAKNAKKKRNPKQNSAAKKTRQKHGVLHAKYAKGKRAYKYGWGPKGHSHVFRTPETFGKAFGKQLAKDEVITSVTPLKGQSQAIDYVVWTKNSVTGEQIKRTYTNVANLDPGKPFNRKKAVMLHFRKERWIQTKTETRSS